MAYLIGINVGGAGVQALLIDTRGRPLASSLQEYPLDALRPRWVEQNPHDWWVAAVDAIKDILRKAKIPAAEVKGVGVSGQAHGLVLLGENGKVLRPAILRNDERAVEECREIASSLSKQILVGNLGSAVLQNLVAPKLVWVRQHEPEIFEQAHTLLLPKDYVRHQLTGELATDVSDASSTLLFDTTNRRWSEAIVGQLQLSMELLPDCYESTEICGTITEIAAETTGLVAGTPVVTGGTEDTCSAIANGIVKSGRVLVSIGTSGIIFTHTDQPTIDPELRVQTLCHSVPNGWGLMGTVLSAGGAFRWFRDALGDAEVAEAKSRGVNAYELLTAQATEAPVGSEGLVFLPYLNGERTPHHDANAKGVYFGLSLRHSKAHVIRATMEGITYAMRDSLEVFRALDLPLERVYTAGGGAQSSLWRQMQADIYNTEVVTVDASEDSAFGAAILAGVGAELFDGVTSATDTLVKIATSTEPSVKSVADYDEYYTIFRSLYPALRPQFDAITALITGEPH